MTSPVKEFSVPESTRNVPADAMLLNVAVPPTPGSATSVPFAANAYPPLADASEATVTTPSI